MGRASDSSRDHKVAAQAVASPIAGLGNDRMGGLVGQADNSSQIIGSRASGNVSDGGVNTDSMGGLVGFAD